MSDIFISYASSDRGAARRFARAFEEVGWTVWWDRQIPAGMEFAEYIRTRIDDTKCVVVLWSATSVDSKWVKREAKRANDQHKLIPVLIDDVAPPWVFEDLQARDLTTWNGGTDDRNFAQLVSDMTRLLGPVAGDESAASGGQGAHPPAMPEDKESVKRSWLSRSRLLVVVALAVAAGLGLLFLKWRSPAGTGIGSTEVQAAISADRETLEQGESTTLHWKTIGAIRVRIEPDVGDVEKNGSVRVSPPRDTAYRVLAKGPSGSAEDSVRIRVTSRPVGSASAATVPREDEAFAANRNDYAVYVLGVPNADAAIEAMRAAGYRAKLYGPSGRRADEFQVISVGAKVPSKVAQELIRLAREHLSGLSYVVVTEDRPDVISAGGTIGGREVGKEIAFAVPNRGLGDFRRITPLPDAGWQRLMAAPDDRAFQTTVRAYYDVGN